MWRSTTAERTKNRRIVPDHLDRYSKNAGAPQRPEKLFFRKKRGGFIRGPDFILPTRAYLPNSVDSLRRTLPATPDNAAH
jgi:hypothetical protein